MKRFFFQYKFFYWQDFMRESERERYGEIVCRLSLLNLVLNRVRTTELIDLRSVKGLIRSVWVTISYD